MDLADYYKKLDKEYKQVELQDKKKQISKLEEKLATCLEYVKQNIKPEEVTDDVHILILQDKDMYPYRKDFVFRGIQSAGEVFDGYSLIYYRVLEDYEPSAFLVRTDLLESYFELKDAANLLEDGYFCNTGYITLKTDHYAKRAVLVSGMLYSIAILIGGRFSDSSLITGSILPYLLGYVILGGCYYLFLKIASKLGKSKLSSISSLTERFERDLKTRKVNNISKLDV